LAEMIPTLNSALISLARIEAHLFADEPQPLFEIGGFPSTPLKSEEDFEKMDKALQDNRVFSTAVSCLVMYKWYFSSNFSSVNLLLGNSEFRAISMNS